VTEPLVFELAMEALLKGASSPLTPRCIERLQSAQLDPRAPLRPTYPANVWAEAVRILGEECYPDLAPHDAHRRLGAGSVDAFISSRTGALMLVLRIIGPSRLFGRLTRSMRTGCNYLETQVTQVGPTTFDVSLHDVLGVEGFYRGMLESGMTHVGAKDLQIEVTSCDSHTCTLRASWRG
jgi:uncharacterized protein (TIGR02265 family)